LQPISGVFVFQKDSFMEIEHKPYRQGHLDKYCGIYCVVNTVHYLRGPICDKHASKLFYKTIKTLNRKVCAVERIGIGTGLGELGELLAQTAYRYQLRLYRPFTQNRGVSLEVYWDSLQQFITHRNGVVLINITGSRDHWTLVKDVTEKSLLLFDSNGMARISKSRSTTIQSKSKRQHVLRPTHTCFIWRQEQGSTAEEGAHD